MPSATLTESIIRAGAGEQSFQRGKALYQSDALASLAIQGQTLSGECEGTSAPFYKVRVELDKGGIASADCSCPYDFGGWCKHIIALSLAYVHEPKTFVVRQEPAALLADLNREQLLSLLTKLLRQQPDLSEWVEAEIASPATTGKVKAAKRRKVDTEVYRRRVRGIMHSLDHMRASEAYWHVGGVANELRGVEETAMEFLKAGDPETALQILKTLLEESHDGFDYIDDSDGELGAFLDSLGETLAEVILSMELDAEQRADIAGDLQELHDRFSDYGVDGLRLAIAAAEQYWDEGDEKNEEDEADEWDEEDEGEFGYVPSWKPASTAQILTRAKLNVLERQGRTDEYLAWCLREDAHLRYALKLCELGQAAEAVAHAMKNLETADDALLLAKHLREADHLDDAIRIGERGLKLDGYKAALGEWLGSIEEAQGRKAQALTAWLAAFHEAPSLDKYQTVKRLAGRRWNNLKPELMQSLQKEWNKQPFVEVLLFEQEWDEAIKVADGKDTYYSVIETVADALIDHRPEWVVRASIKQAERLMVEPKSKNYPYAANWLRKAKAAYAQLGQQEKWQKYLQKLKEEYRRRPALQAQLARV